ncbi:MAG: hypothetical protein QM728_00685 [Gordonia sp. (in: high G+C Gram-positive bacteria)]|uniref:hypothetical protein n=1 Tax=Gordonia sp. (in: high G+C Gram-positive bacteria) TaxID=84139 RepID=UPI0039E67230
MSAAVSLAAVAAVFGAADAGAWIGVPGHAGSGSMGPNGQVTITFTNNLNQQAWCNYAVYPSGQLTGLRQAASAMNTAAWQENNGNPAYKATRARGVNLVQQAGAPVKRYAPQAYLVQAARSKTVRWQPQRRMPGYAIFSKCVATSGSSVMNGRLTNSDFWAFPVSRGGTPFGSLNDLFPWL